MFPETVGDLCHTDIENLIWISRVTQPKDTVVVDPNEEPSVIDTFLVCLKQQPPPVTSLEPPLLFAIRSTGFFGVH
jgi:hypothetical protein